METHQFKAPYRPGELAARPLEEKLEFMIKAEGALIGWGFVFVTPNGLEGPTLVDKCLFPQGHPRAGLEKLIKKRHAKISRSLDYAIDIFIHPKFLDKSTVESDPDADHFPVTRFLEHPKAYMVLANGHRRVHCVKDMMSMRPTGDQSISWLAKFYDLGKSHTLSPRIFN